MSTETGTEIVGVDRLQEQVAPVVARASALAIVTPQDYENAAGFLQDVKAAQKRVNDFFDPMIESAHKTWKSALAQKATFADPLKSAEATTKHKALAWQAEQERIRQAEQRRLQAEADERARKEREKQEAAARLQREKEEAARRAEEDARRQAQAATDAKAREAALREAEKRRAEAEAAAAKAAVREDAATVVVAPVVHVASVTPKIKGQSTATVWKARVTHIDLVPREYLIVNDQALQAFARATKGAVKLPGVEMYQETTMRSGGR